MADRRISDVVPDMVGGFAVRVSVGGAPGKQGLFVTLLPTSEEARRAMRQLRQQEIVASVRITDAAAEDLRQDANSRLAQDSVEGLLRRAVALARRAGVMA